MKFKDKLLAIANTLGFAEKVNTNSMLAADWPVFAAAYKKEYGVDLKVDQDAYVAEQTELSAKSAQLEADYAAAQTIISAAMAEVSGETVAAPAAGATPIQTAEVVAAAIRQMAGTAIPDQPATVGAGVSVNGPGHTATHFCGINHPLYSMDKRSNRISLTPSLSASEPVNEKAHGEQFRSDLREYSSMVASRINVLRAEKAMVASDLASGVTVSIDPEGLGNQYLTRRVDALIARLAVVKNIYDIFPRRSGVQDREVMVNAFFGDYSQAYQEGDIFKGSVELIPEFCYVDDAMLKTRFGSMKKIERQYIGYLNTDGSDPIKWSLIEWVMLQVSTKLIEEQSKRKVLGLYIKPIEGVAGHYLNSGTGVVYMLLQYYNEGKISRLAEPVFQSYTSGAVMVGTVIAQLAKLAESGVANLDRHEVILNSNHKAMWIKGVRDLYGKDTDFKGPNGDKVPDYLNDIRWLDGLENLPFVIIQPPKNIQAIEGDPGEMFNINFESHMESVVFWAVWKEGSAAEYAGKKFSSKAARAAHGFADQMIFTNFPAKEIEADATSIDVSSNYRLYITSANTQATAIADIVGAKVGAAYQIEIGSEVNPSTIAKTGKFADITAPFNPTKIGDYILVAPNADCSKFLELERCENGARKINVALQPNVPGGR